MDKELNVNEENPKTHPQGNAVKDPSDWVTADEPMTGAQASYVKTLSEEAGQEFNPEMTKAEASKTIEELQAKRVVASNSALNTLGP